MDTVTVEAALADLLETSAALYQRRLTHASGGNTSVRVGDTIWITGTGTVLGSLTVDDLVPVSLVGTVLSDGKPSKELGMHLAMYQNRPEAAAVVHAHPTYSIAYSTLLPAQPSLDAIPAYTGTAYQRAGRVPMLVYYPSGSEALHHSVAALDPVYCAVLLQQHGVTVAAPTLGEALAGMEEIEQCCHIALLTDRAGATITDEQKMAIDDRLGRGYP